MGDGRPQAEDAWFRYTRSAGRITAAPANAKGWAALVGAILAPLFITGALGPMAMRAHPLLFALMLSVAICGSLFVLFRLVLAKGRPSA